MEVDNSFLLQNITADSRDCSVEDRRFELYSGIGCSSAFCDNRCLENS